MFSGLASCERALNWGTSGAAPAILFHNCTDQIKLEWWEWVKLATETQYFYETSYAAKNFVIGHEYHVEKSIERRASNCTQRKIEQSYGVHFNSAKKFVRKARHYKLTFSQSKISWYVGNRAPTNSLGADYYTTRQENYSSEIWLGWAIPMITQ